MLFADKDSGAPTVVLLATFNGRKWLPQQVDSILGQRGVELKLIVSDDMSTDGTWEWLQTLATSDSRVILLPQIGKFGNAGKNFFRLLRDGDFTEYQFVSFADQDDIWLPDKLLNAQDALQRERVDCYSSNVIAFWPNNRKKLIRKAQPQRQWDFLFEAAGPGCTYVVRANVASTIKAKVASRWESLQGVALHDWFVYALARADGYKWFIDERPGLLYRQHEHNVVGVNSGFQALLSRARVVSSGWALGQSQLIAHIIGVDEKPFVKKWINNQRLGTLFLASRFYQCRRRWSDKLLFLASCLWLFAKRSLRPE